MHLPSLCRVLAACAGAGFCAVASTALPASFKTIYTFNANTDGSAPQSELTQGTDGNLYGTNSSDGNNGNGSVFRINTSGSSFVSLSSLGPVSKGIKPIGGLVQASDGLFYGTTYGGGDNAIGTFFKVTSAGALTLLNSFNAGDPGSNPVGTLTEGIDGFLYGTAQLGGLNNDGTVFRATLASGDLVTVSTFSGGTDGLYPESDLVQASDGNFYGTTTRGGTSDAGTVFRVSPSGIRTVIYSFTGNTDGREPLRGVTLGRDGNLYGIARTAGAGGGGTIYRVTTAGVFTLLYSFSPSFTTPYFSYGRLVQASDGNFYGTTNLGGTFNAGTIFRVTPTGGFTLIYSFTNGTDSGYPKAGLVQATDGKLYGTTAGLNGSDSTVFQLDLDLAPSTPQPVLTTPVKVSVGDTLFIAGDYFLGTTAVTFPSTSGSVPATNFSVLSKNMLSVVVPPGAITGVVTVAHGTLSASTPSAITVNVPTTGGGGGGGNTDKGVVTITAPDPVAAEPGKNRGRFNILRKGGDLTKSLTVVIKVQGAAKRGADYYLSNGGQRLATVTNSITIPAKKTSTDVYVNVLDDTIVESDESVILKLSAGANYTVGSPNKATIIIADND